MSALESIPVSARIGAEVRGADLASIDDALFEAVHAALLEYQVLFFRQTGLSDEQHLALASRFGPVSVFPLSKVMGASEPSFQVIDDGPDNPPTADNWHTDVSWIAEPPKVGLLRATVVPERGGDTMWGSMTAAYEALSPPLQRLMEGLSVVHDSTFFISAVEDKLGRAQADELGVADKLRAEFPPVEHPLIRTHPETGRQSLFSGGYFMRRVVGFEPRE
jgi:taurine dioxygenase